MKKLAVVFISVFFCSLSFSQQDEKARKILDKVSTEINSYSTFKVKYFYRYEDVKTGDESEEYGTAYVKGDKYMIDLESYEVYYNGRSLYNYVKGRNEVTIVTPRDNDVSLDFTNPKQIFQFWDEDFKYKFVQNEEFEGGNVQRIDLFPKESGESSYSRIKMLVNPGLNQIRFLKVFGKDGTRFSFNIKNIKPNLDISSDKFTFDKDDYPGIEVIDMRF